MRGEPMTEGKKNRLPERISGQNRGEDPILYINEFWQKNKLRNE